MSGSVASGQLWHKHLASGQIIQYMLVPTVERVSGFRAVCLNSGNVVLRSHPGSGLQLPAAGIVASNFESGAVAFVHLFGPLQTPTVDVNTLDATWSGMAGKMLFVGSGGVVVTFSGLLSGDGYQRLGVATSGGVILQPNAYVTSGAVTLPMAGAPPM